VCGRGVQSNLVLVRPWCDHRAIGRAATTSGTSPGASTPEPAWRCRRSRRCPGGRRHDDGRGL